MQSESEQLRILMIVEASAGGTGRHVLDLAEGLSQRGHRVHLIHSTRRVDRLFSDRLEAIDGLTALGLPMRTAPHPHDALLLAKIHRYARRHGPFHIIHGHSSKGGALARLVALGTGARVCYTLHGLIMMDPQLKPMKKRLYLGIERLLAPITQSIIAVSPEEQRAAVARGLGDERVHLVPNGVGPSQCRQRVAARSSMGLGERDIAVGFVGRLVEQKAPHILLRAFASAHEGCDRLRLAIVGDGPLKPSLLRLAEQLEIARKVIWLGEWDARDYLEGFDIFALSSRKEGLPYVVLEAMASGLPVVATRSAGVELLTRPNFNGHVVETDDADAFGGALLHLAIDEPTRARFGLNARAHSRRFTVQGMVARTLQVYRADAAVPATIGAEQLT